MLVKMKFKRLLLQTNYDYVTGSDLISNSKIQFNKHSFIANVKNPMRPIFKHLFIGAINYVNSKQYFVLRKTRI